MYIIMCIAEFARHKNISEKDAFVYLKKFGGMAFLEEFYDIEHTLSLEDTMGTLTELCQKSGGDIE
jgi:hypothetical protein